MKKGKELKRRTAAVLIASMIAANLTTPVLAEPVGSAGAGEITSHETKWGGTKVTVFCANGNDATIALDNGDTRMSLDEDPGKSVVLKPTEADGVVAVYAGRWDNTSVTDPVTLTMESGEVDYLIGGSAGIVNDQAAGFKLSESTINLKGGTVQDVMASRPSKNPSGFDQCGNNLVDTCTINLSGGTVKGQLGGTFSYSQVNTLNVNMTGGTIGQRLVLGGTNGYVKEANLSVSGGTTPNISAGLRALVDSMEVSVTGGNAGEIYAGSLYPDEETSLGANPGSEKPWDGWSYGGVDYGIAKDVKVTISGKAKYDGVYGGFQHGIQKASSSEAEVFEKAYSGKISKAISDAYQFGKPTRTEIHYSVKPQGGKNFKYTRDLLKEKVENVTANDYTDSKLSISETSSKMKLGEVKELTAEYKTADGATPSEASPGEADYVWTSSDEDVVSITSSGDGSAELTALKPGTAVVKVSYRGLLEAACNVTVSKPDLSVSLKSRMEYADENTWLTAKVDHVADDLKDDVKYEVSVDRPGLFFEEEWDGEPGRFQAIPEYGLSGTYDVTVTAEVGESIFTANKTLTVEKPKFAVTVSEGSKSLDVKGSETAVLEITADYEEYDSYEWSAEGKAVEMASPAEADAFVEITAAEEGTSVISVKARRDSFYEDGPNGQHEVPAVEEKASITIKVADTRQFKVDKNFVEFDINPEAEKRSETVEVINDYGDLLTVEVADDTQPVKAELNGGILTISTTAEETGSATVVISRENGETIEIPVIIKTTAIAAEVKNGIEVVVKDDAVSVPEVKTEGLSEEQKAEAEAKTAEQADTVKNAITEVFAKVASDEAVAEYLASRMTGMSEAAMEYATDNGLKAENGDIVKVYPKQELQNVELDTEVKVDAETGEVTVLTVIRKMTFNIKLMMDKLDENDRPVAGGTLDIPRTNRKPISFPIPLPDEGLADGVNYVKVTHAGDENYFPIRENAGIRYTVITTYHFSPFELEFVKNIPSVSRGSRSSGGGSSYTTGRWIQDATGWWYKNPDGSWPAACWKQLLWNNQMEWYYFNAEGYMMAGWFTDIDGNRYFLHNVSDGNQGRMYTGWHQIDGKWYYFKENEGGPKGSLLVNGVTPDGYQTNLFGVCADYQGEG